MKANALGTASSVVMFTVLLGVTLEIGIARAGDPTGGPSTHPTDEEVLLRSKFISCFSGNFSDAKVVARCEAMKKEVVGTSIADDLDLVIAKRKINLEDPSAAIALLKPLVQEKEATVVSLANLSRSGMSPGDWKIAETFSDYFAKSPNKSSDEALLLLATAHADNRQVNESWEDLTLLRKKYPAGDRAEEDARVFERVFEENKLPARIWRSDQAGYDALTRHRRPHLVALLSQYYSPQQKERLTPIERVALTDEIVHLYQKLLTGEELSSICDHGLALTEAVAPTDKLNKGRTIADAQHMFMQFKEAMIQDLKDHPLPKMKIVHHPDASE